MKEVKNSLENKARHKIVFTVRAHQVDHRQQLKAAALGDMLIVLSQEHSFTIGVSVDKLMKSGMSWVLARLSLEMKEWPDYLDKISIETWIDHVGKFKSVRKYRICKNNRHIGTAYTLWSMFDLKRRRPVTLDQFALLKKMKLEIKQDSIKDHLPKLSFSDIKKKVGEFRAQYSDVDILSHMYSIKYLERAMNFLEMKLFDEKRLSKVQLNFLKEINFHNLVKVYKSKTNNAVSLSFLDGISDKPLFHSKFHFNDEEE